MAPAGAPLPANRTLRNAPLPAAAPDAFTFEAWLSTSDFCHASAIFSYAMDSAAAVRGAGAGAVLPAGLDSAGRALPAQPWASCVLQCP